MVSRRQHLCWRATCTSLLLLLLLVLSLKAVRGDTAPPVYSLPLDSRRVSPALNILGTSLEFVDGGVAVKLHVDVDVLEFGCDVIDEVYCTEETAVSSAPQPGDYCYPQPIDDLRRFVSGAHPFVQRPAAEGHSELWNATYPRVVRSTWEATTIQDHCMSGVWHVGVHCARRPSTFVHRQLYVNQGASSCPTLDLELQETWCDGTRVRARVEGLASSVVRDAHQQQRQTYASNLFNETARALIDSGALPATVTRVVNGTCPSPPAHNHTNTSSPSPPASASRNCTVEVAVETQTVLSDWLRDTSDTLYTVLWDNVTEDLRQHQVAGWLVKAAVPIGDPRGLGVIRQFDEQRRVLAANYLLYVVWRAANGELADTGPDCSYASDPARWPNRGLSDVDWATNARSGQPGADFVAVTYARGRTDWSIDVRVPVDQNVQWVWAFLPVDTTCGVSVRTLDPRLVQCEDAKPYEFNARVSFVAQHGDWIVGLYGLVMAAFSIGLVIGVWRQWMRFGWLLVALLLFVPAPISNQVGFTHYVVATLAALAFTLVYICARVASLLLKPPRKFVIPPRQVFVDIGNALLFIGVSLLVTITFVGLQR